LNLQEEIREIFGHLRNRIEAYQEIGFDPPHILLQDLKYSGPGTIETEHASDLQKSPETLEDLRAHIGNCTKCKLHKGRTKLVFGEGSPRARLVFVGEGPGRDEDLAGRPFVGEAGKLLTKIIENGMGLDRKDVFICNVVKCRPPKNRDPEGDEIKSCITFLKQQLEIIKPDIICALGRVAGQTLLGGDFKISRQRGQWYTYMGLPVMPTYHPAYLLRYPSAKRQVWDDVQKIMKRMGL